MLKWVRNQVSPCLWETNTCRDAACNGHLEVLKWAREQGLSQRKHEYIKSIAENIVSNKLSLEIVKKLADDARKYLYSLLEEVDGEEDERTADR